MECRAHRPSPTATVMVALLTPAPPIPEREGRSNARAGGAVQPMPRALPVSAGHTVPGRAWLGLARWGWVRRDMIGCGRCRQFRETALHPRGRPMPGSATAPPASPGER
eukprot:scaffold29442_cov107-Isochrysis_galbana.AAC.3